MATAADVIEWALKDAGIIGEGDTPSSETTDDAFDLLNQMLALWQVENLNVYAQQENSFSPTGATTYTVGSGGAVNITRPEKIDLAFWRYGDLDYPLTVLETFEQYESIAQKTQAGEPLLVFYRPSYPLGTLYVYPQPSTGAIHLVAQVRFPTLSSTATTITLPPEYILPIRSNLAVMLCATFQVPAPQQLVKLAQTTKMAMQKNNLRIEPLPMPGAIPSRARPNIFAGQ